MSLVALLLPGIVSLLFLVVASPLVMMGESLRYYSSSSVGAASKVSPETLDQFSTLSPEKFHSMRERSARHLREELNLSRRSKRNRVAKGMTDMEENGPWYPHHNGSCVAGCTPVGDDPVSYCDWYLERSPAGELPINTTEWKGGDFLMPTYGTAAKCACSGYTDPAWLSPSAKCVRTHLHRGHVALSPETKWAWRTAMLNNSHDQTGIIGFADKLANWSSYALEPVYKLHQEAYKNCCCPDKIAPKFDWLGIFVGGSILTCPLIIDAIELFGFCGCQGW